MEIEVAVVSGAGDGESHRERITRRNGCRSRRLGSHVGGVDVRSDPGGSSRGLFGREKA
jgi:hypothetical protein